MATTPYADEAYGVAYFSERLRTGAWDDATSDLRTRALKQATRAIDKLNFAGHKHDRTLAIDGTPNQPNQFPRGDDTVVPDAVKQATCELALALLDDVDPNLEIENQNIASQRLGDFSINRNAGTAQEHVMAGIPSIQAWTLLQPFLRDPRIMDVDRS